MSQAGIADLGSIPPPPGSVTDIQGQDGITVSPNGSGIIFVQGAVVPAGTTPFTTSGNAGTSTETWSIQRTQAFASSDATRVGLASFNSAQFSVDANGYVSSTQVDLHITPFIVSAAGITNGASYTTVQAAVTAANAAGGGAVYVQPGTYTENLTLFSNVSIVGTDPLRSIITGVHTPPASGTVTFENITLNSATSIFSSAAAGSTNITLITCVMNVTSGYVFDLLNWTGTLFFYGCGATGTTDGGINNTGGATVIINDSTVGTTGGAMIASAGTVTIQGSRLNCAATFGGDAVMTAVDSYFGNTLTYTGTATGTLYHCTLVAIGSPAITQSSTGAVKLTQATIDSDNTPVISGAGAGGVTLGDVEYITNCSISTSFVTTYMRETGRISPYVVGASGNYASIQEAIDELKPQFGPHVIYLQGGALYVESLDFTGFTFPCNVIIRATPLFADSSVDGAAIIGNITPPNSGQIFFENLNLIASTGDIFTSAAAGQATIWLRNCNTETILGGFIFGLLNWTSPALLVLENYRASATGTDNSLINNTGGATLQILESTYVGTATGSTSVISGPTLFRNSVFYCPLNFVTGSSFTIVGSTFNAPVTLSNNSTGTIEDCVFSTGASAALTMSSSAAVSLISSTITTSNNPAIAGAGAGTLTYEDIVFTSNSAFAGTLTLATVSWQPYSRAIAATDGTKVGTAAFNSAQFTVDTSGFVSLIGGGVAADSFAMQTGTSPVVPTSGGLVTFNGAVVAAGTNPVRTDGTGANTMALEVQISQAVAATDATRIGLSNFNSAHFTVDANGFVSSLGAGFPWIDQATGITLAVNTGYFVTAATTQILPAAPTQGQVVKIVADTTGAVVVTANTGQTIRLGNLTSSVAGTMTSTLRGDCMELVFRAATSTWISIADNGVWVAA